VFWTSDEGATWNDITPPIPENGALRDLFFLDTKQAWAAIDWFSDLPVQIVHTTDGGRVWNSHPFDEAAFPSLKEVGAMPVSMLFADARHGLFLWRIQSSSATSAGMLFRTDDGGKTWHELPHPPSAGELRFHSPKDGWVVVGAESEGIAVTHDGGKTWEAKSVTPPSICAECRGAFMAPAFNGLDDGVLAATYYDYSAPDVRSVNATYSTHDAGNSWQLSEAFESQHPNSELVSLTGGHAIRVFSDPANARVQIRDARNIIETRYPQELRSRGRITAISFVDPSDGWAIYYNGAICLKFRDLAKDGRGLPCLEMLERSELLSTTDGGRTFTVITPLQATRTAVPSEPTTDGKLRPIP
jgi:photosystem II stability/assembly factor-like uncharacterized protein